MGMKEAIQEVVGQAQDAFKKELDEEYKRLEDQYWAKAPEPVEKNPPMLSKLVDEELEKYERVLRRLREGGVVEFRARKPDVDAPWRKLQLGMRDPIDYARLNFTACEFRIPPETKEITVWVTVTMSGLVHGMFTNKEDADRRVRTCSYPLRVIPLCATVEVL